MLGPCTTGHFIICRRANYNAVYLLKRTFLLQLVQQKICSSQAVSQRCAIITAARLRVFLSLLKRSYGVCFTSTRPTRLDSTQTQLLKWIAKLTTIIKSQSDWTVGDSRRQSPTVELSWIARSHYEHLSTALHLSVERQAVAYGNFEQTCCQIHFTLVFAIFCFFGITCISNVFMYSRALCNQISSQHWNMSSRISRWFPHWASLIKMGAKHVDDFQTLRGRFYEIMQ